MRKQFIFLLILVFVLGLAPVNFSDAQDLADRLRGKILLQVESNGEAWYVNPDNSNRYYLGRPADAFNVMRELGLGISNKDFDSFNNIAPKRLSGKILLKVEDSGKAYYINPDDLKMHYLGRPADAFRVMRELGLGISDDDLSEISISNDSTLPDTEIQVEGIEYSECGDGYVLYSDKCITYNEHCHIHRGEYSYAIEDSSLPNGHDCLCLKGYKLYFNNETSSLYCAKDEIETSNNNNSPFITEEDNKNLLALINNVPKVNKTLYLKDFYGDKISISIDIPLDYYLYYKNKPHNMGENNEDITAFITPEDYFIKSLLILINDNNRKAQDNETPFHGYSVNGIGQIVQNNYYIEDWHSGFDEYPKYPIETIFEGNGDCEDLSFLTATLLKSTSDNNYFYIRQKEYSVALIATPNHLGVGLHYEGSDKQTKEEAFNYILDIVKTNDYNGYYELNGKKYFYIETTNPEFRFGEIPDELLNKETHIYPLSYKW